MTGLCLIYSLVGTVLDSHHKAGFGAIALVDFHVDAVSRFNSEPEFEDPQWVLMIRTKSSDDLHYRIY